MTRNSVQGEETPLGAGSPGADTGTRAESGGTDAADPAADTRADTGPAAGTRAARRRSARRGSGHRGPRRRRGAPSRGRRALRWSATVLAVLILGTAGAGYLYYRHLNANLEKGERSSGDSKARKAAPNAAGETPLNILVIGSDSRASDENVRLGGSRNTRDNPPLGDVQMLVHLSADRKSAAVVSIPRDTRVDIPRCKDPRTGQVYPPVNTIINASLARGGAGCTLATWENLTGVYIDHWMTIDFAGVVSMADAVGGVEVCVKQNVHDRPLPGVPGGSGLKLTAGRHEVKGKQALQWLRTRHAWGSDQLRARAQHMYLNAMIRSLKEQNVFTDAGRLMDLAEAATKALTVSEEIGSVRKLYELGQQLRTVPTDRITMTTMPNVTDPQNPNHLLPGPGAERMWRMLRDDVPFDKKGARDGEGSGNGGKKAEERTSKDPAAPDDEIAVLVRNATRTSAEAAVPGRATALARVLAGKGFTRARADTSPPLSAERTQVRFPSADLEGDAQRVAKALGIPLSAVRESAEVSGVTVVVGADWRSGTAYPKRSAPKAGDLPSGSDEINAADRTPCMDVYKPYRW